MGGARVAAQDRSAVGRYLALTRLSREDRPPDTGEPADIVLVDLQTGEQKILAQTGSVAYIAHVGGFLAGFVLTFLFRGRGRP